MEASSKDGGKHNTKESIFRRAIGRKQEKKHDSKNSYFFGEIIVLVVKKFFFSLLDWWTCAISKEHIRFVESKVKKKPYNNKIISLKPVCSLEPGYFQQTEALCC